MLSYFNILVIFQALNSKQRTEKRKGNDLNEADQAELDRVTAGASDIQKALEKVRKQLKQHTNIMNEYKAKKERQQKLEQGEGQIPNQPIPQQPQQGMIHVQRAPMPGRPPQMQQQHMMRMPQFQQQQMRLQQFPNQQNPQIVMQQQRMRMQMPPHMQQQRMNMMRMQHQQPNNPQQIITSQAPPQVMGPNRPPQPQMMANRMPSPMHQGQASPGPVSQSSPHHSQPSPMDHVSSPGQVRPQGMSSSSPMPSPSMSPMHGHPSPQPSPSPGLQQQQNYGHQQPYPNSAQSPIGGNGPSPRMHNPQGHHVSFNLIHF